MDQQRWPALVRAILLVFVLPAIGRAQLAEPWERPYAGHDADGPHVLAFWRFEPGQETVDSSGRGHTLRLEGAVVHSDGRFGGCLESFPGWPVSDTRHGAVAAHHANLSPSGPFSLEMWIQAKPELKDHPHNVYLVDKKYVTHQDYQLILDRPSADGGRNLKAVLGFGEDSETWHADQPLKLEPGVWTHLAMTYDAAGTLRFYLDGVPIGGGERPRRGAMAGGRRGLSIGDRGGSLYAGFPGYIDEVRLTSGVREFRSLSVTGQHRRRVFLRGEPSPELVYRVTNHLREPLDDVRMSVGLPPGEPRTLEIGRLESGEARDVSALFDTRLRPDRYELNIHVSASRAGRELHSAERLPVTLVPRPSPQRMPVVMWGIGGIDGVTQELPRLKQIGFTHCLGLSCDYAAVWNAGEPTSPTSQVNLAAADAMLDEALANDLGIIVNLSPGTWLQTRPDHARVDRSGQPYSRVNLANVSPDVERFFFNVGASVSGAWGDHPAVRGAMINTEVRDGTAPSFHPRERRAFREYSGFEIPDAVRISRGVSWTELDDIPKDRIVPDDHPLLTYYRWFWKTGDGWNSWHSALHRGFHAADERRQAGPPLWTFFDPAVRAPSIYGSGGEVDYLSHWTYTYPDPIRIGLCTDELLAMARGASRDGQQVMKMTQLIWYRSQTAPVGRGAGPVERSPWEDFDPDAAYITIAPMHLREALWLKLSRPVQGIMYHGWGSLVPGSTSSYRYTHPETQHELARLIRDVVEPLGPALRQIPAADADVALLESFTSQMLARRGTYGWGQSWAADCWHALQYAHLQTEIIYEETILDQGLDRYRVLVLPDCDVLPKSVADRILAFQRNGGVIVGDERLAPGINPEIRLRAYTRQRQADVDQQALMSIAAELREALRNRYLPDADADQPDVILHRRRAGEGEYLFAVNDRREFGQYVGQHQLVMEQGLPATAVISLGNPQGFVYDLRRQRPVDAERDDGRLHWAVTLPPADGGLFLITPQPIQRLHLESAEEAAAGETVLITIRVTDAADRAINAVIPLQIDILDPDGRPAEFSGAHAAVAGTFSLPLEIASNDVRGVWTIRVREGASGLVTERFLRIR